VNVQNEPVVKATVSRGICQGPFCMPVLDSMVLHGLSCASLLAGAIAKPEGTPAPVPAPLAFVNRPGKLTPAAEAKLLIHFELQDTLTREESKALAEQA
jgi:hypothetical protein